MIIAKILKRLPNPVASSKSKKNFKIVLIIPPWAVNNQIPVILSL
jgi:hypothetical protein